MKRLIVTDTHLGLYADSDLWLDIVLNFFKHIVKYCHKNDIKQLIHLGDFFNNRKNLNTKTQHAAHKIAEMLSYIKELETYIIVGNHDCYYKNQIQPNTLELFKEYKHIKVIDEITNLDDILLVPWGEVPESNQGAKYCFGHFAINGFHMNDTYRCKNGTPIASFKDFEKVLSGHFHTPSSNHNITYLGAPYGQTIHDAGGVRGYHIFEDGNLEFIEYNDAPKFIKLYTSTEALDENEIKGNIIKIIFTRDFGTNQNQEIIDNIIKCNPLLYSVNFANLDSEDEIIGDESVVMDSKEKIVDQFIDDCQFSTNINAAVLKAMFRKLMKEAGESSTNIKTAEGTKIECEEIGFQNFLSFGSQWQDIPLKKGVNFVTGYDKDKAKSNGAGKSSFLETIPFALFGKTARDIKQNQIINWKNNKNCQVVFRFKINNDIYEINRTLKPNKLEIFKNGDLIDQDAHKADYQSMFENIFGMDVKMFMSLIHSNVNNSGSILSMSKAEKRKFLERMFGLEIYSHMNKLSNEKLRDVENKKYKIETDIRSCDDRITAANELKIKFNNEINSKKESLENVKEIKEELERLKEDNPTLEADIDALKKEIEAKREDFHAVTLEYEKQKAKQDIRLEQIKKDINKIESQEEQRKKNDELNEEIKKIVDKVGNVYEILEKITQTEGNVTANFTDLEGYNNTLLEYHKEYTELETNLKNTQKNLDLLAEGKCPTCGQDVTDPKTHYKKEKTSLKRKITIIKKKISENESSIRDINEDNDVLKKKIKILHKTRDRLTYLGTQIKEVGSEEKKDELVQTQSLIAQNMMDSKEIYKKRERRYNGEINALNNKNSDLNAILGIFVSKSRDYDMAKSQAQEVKKHVHVLKGMIKEQDEVIHKINKEIEESGGKKIKLNNIKDYLNSIKMILKDENIKQFTIKQIMPYLNKQTNYYLSEVNYGFYVVIDKWLDVTIKGPGIKNATYESLSGGEKRGIDISLQLSLLDIAQVQSGIFPDILVFDELLDSSIDGVGMEQLMKIIKVKQNESNNKIFIISHRQEIDAELIDNEYHVEKENGYSKVLI